MVTDRQVRRLMSLLQSEQSLQISAEKVGMDRETARKYRKIGKLPSEARTDHNWRTRADPFAEVWPWVAEQLSVNPGLEARTLLEALQRGASGLFCRRAVADAAASGEALAGPGRAWQGGVLCPGASSRPAVPVGLFAHDQAGRDGVRSRLFRPLQYA